MKRSDERRRFLEDIIVAAVEGGTGYWAQVSLYRWREETYATLHELNDAENGYREEGMLLDVDAVARGIGRIRGGEVQVGDTLRKLILYADRANDAGDIDADAADVIAQAGLLGEVRYG